MIEIFQLIGNQWRKITSFLLLITLCGGFSSFAIPPTYEAKIDLLINNPTKDEGSTVLETYEIDMNLRLIETYKYILKSDRMMANVNAEFNKPYTNGELMEKIKIVSTNESQILTIIANEKSQKQAALLVNTYAATFQKEIKDLMHLENIKVLKEVSAEKDTRKVKPNHAYYFILSFVCGLLLCVTIVIAREVYFTKMDSVVKTERATGMTNLGTIPFMDKILLSQMHNDGPQGSLFTNGNLPDFIIEEYRRLRENIEFMLKGRGIKTIMITSSSPGDGKSTISSNLAMIMAMNGKKTIYIDADLRKSTGRTLFNLPKRKGLTSAIAGHETFESIIQATEIENLSFISAGPQPLNPTKFLSSARMKELLEQLAKKFDVIIIDSPPLLVVDAVTLSSIVDGCLFVIDAKSTKEELAMKSLAQLTKVNAPLLGTVLNRTDPANSNTYY
ncbi:polysaccharide biosynthesis tyrosine autokinase [Sporosarcina sp. YIM B06819]|uniref:polysaccharide biosynthesis tyrosine autokinase n=1 Tax=Sporosarcina sp. YIM B06819 TaxID=3081769 RepID=UPI00298D040E|nr:polysaccharide biosynthesis tyrosine autokinase [Sporosarcina sp. YIM B06819]